MSLKKYACPGIPFAALLLAAAPAVCFSSDSSSPAPAADPPAPAEQVLFDALPVVEAAALHVQTLKEAPANVTIVSAADIHRYGYRTLVEALAGVRGFYTSYDHIYNYVGVRGISLPGDYNTRFLVMLNGHPLTDNVYSSNGLFGQDLGIDLDLVERIEIIRGPSSALYGSNGMLANINIVTRSPVDMEPLRVSLETGSFGEKKALISSSLSLGHGANLLLSSSVFNNSGQTLNIPEFGSTTSGVDGERGYHTFANLIWRDWSFTAYFNSREKQPPLPWGDDYIDFSHRGDRVRDSRNFVRAAYSRSIGTSGKLHWDLAYDNYRYDDRFDHLADNGQGIEDVRNRARGDWIDSQLTYSHPLPHVGTLTVGTQVNFELRNLQQDITVSPGREEGPLISHPDRTGALFAQQEWNLSRKWTAYAGARFDVSRNYRNFLSPRLALVFQPSADTAYKLVYGRPFRNPSAFEQYYNDNGVSFAASPGLRHETAQTFEASIERKLRRNLDVVINAYDYELHDLIQAAFLPGAVEQYQNFGQDRSTGVEFEVSGKPNSYFEATASLAVQRAAPIGAGQLANSPDRIGKLRFAVPLLSQKLWLSSAFQYLSPRGTRSGAVLRSVVLGDLTISTQRLHPQFDLQFGLRNLMNWQYADPIALAVEKIQGTGISGFFKLIWHPWE